LNADLGKIKYLDQ